MSTTIILFMFLSQMPDDSFVIEAARERINPVLKAPSTAKYEITGKEGKARYPIGKVFKGSVNYINDALSEKGYMTVNGNYNAQNSYGVFLRGTWIAFVKGDGGPSRIGCILISSSDGNARQVYQSAEFEELYEAVLYKYLKDVFSSYAFEVYQVEKATEKHPYNNPNRQKLYWGELNKRARSIVTNFGITDGELELAFVIGVKKVWPTKEKTHFDACNTMIRRKYKDTATAIRRLNANYGLQQISALTEAAVGAATKAAVSTPVKTHVNPW